MDALIAIVHIAGTLLSLSILGVLWWLVAAWETSRSTRKQEETILVELGLKSDVTVTDDVRDGIWKWLAARYSDELFRNRLSDLCGVVRTAWDTIGILCTAGTVCFAIWQSFSYKADAAAYAWWAVPIWLFFVISGVLFSLLCKLLTGRYPGQAKAARKGLAKAISEAP